MTSRANSRISLGFAILLCLLSPGISNGAGEPSTSPDRLAHEIIGILQETAGLEIPSWRIHFGPTVRGEGADYDDRRWPSIPSTLPWREVATGKDDIQEVWFRGWFIVPERAGVIPIHHSGIHFEITLHAGTATVWVDETEAVQLGCGSGPCPDAITGGGVLARDARPGQRFSVVIRVEDPAGLGPQSKFQWADTSPIGAPVDLSWDEFESVAKLRLIPEETEPFRSVTLPVLRDILNVQSMLNLAPPQQETQWRRKFQDALNQVDLIALEAKDIDKYSNSLHNCLQSLNALDGAMQAFGFQLTALIHHRIDTGAGEAESVETAAKNLGLILDVLNRNPRIAATHTQPAIHAWLQKVYPGLHEQLRQLASEGRYEPGGVFWTMPNPAAVTGESLIRQMLYGIHYLREEMKFEAHEAYLPDTCVSIPSLPELLTGCGIKTLVILPGSVTWKHYQREKNHRLNLPCLGWWNGTGGSRILTYMPPRGVVEDLKPESLIRTLDEWLREEQLPETGLLYSHWEHGWSPDRALFQEAEKLVTAKPFPKVRFGTMTGWTAQIEKQFSEDKKDNLPQWKGDLYTPHHRDDLSSQPELKQMELAAENALITAERMAAAATRIGTDYPTEKLELSWLELLTRQSDALLSGKTEKTNHTKDVFRQIRDTALSNQHESFDSIAGHINTAQLENPVLVYNPVSWIRNGIAEIALKTGQEESKAAVTDVLGADIPCQIVIGENENRTLLIETKDLPPDGYNTYQVRFGKTSRATMGMLKVGGRILENNWLRLELDKHTGHIASLYDKINQRQVFGEGGGAKWQLATMLPASGNPWKEDGLSTRDIESEWITPEAKSIKIIEKGPIRAAIRVTYEAGETILAQTFRMFAGEPGVEVLADVYQLAAARSLALGFNLGFVAPRLTCAIPYGYVHRGAGKSEIPAFPWTYALAEDRSYSLCLSAGAHLINRFDGQNLHTFVMKTGTEEGGFYPNGQAENKKDIFAGEPYRLVYRMDPSGTLNPLEEAGIQITEAGRRGIELNTPLLTKWEEAHLGILDTKQSWLDISSATVFCTAWKQSLDDPDALIVRLQQMGDEDKDRNGTQEPVLVTMPGSILEVWRTNHLEEQGQRIPHTGSTFEIRLQPHEIATFMVKLEPAKVP